MTAPFRTELIVESFVSGKRIDTFLERHFRNYSSHRLQRIVRAGEVRINDVPADNDSRVYRGQRVEVRLIEPPDLVLPPVAGPLEILFEDSWLIIVSKPAGQIVHPAGNYPTNSLANVLQHHLDLQTPWRGLLRPGIVHRLDRMTSGVMVISKEHHSHALLTEAFMQRKVHKTYLALVEGVVELDSGTLNKPIGESVDPASCLMTTHPNARDPRSALTRFRVLERFPNHTLVEAKPVTGRQHQIRIHLADIGHPVVDDEFYGPFGWIKKDPDGNPISKPNWDDDVETPSAAKTDQLLVGRHALHAHRLEFRHPITWEPLSFEAPLPADMEHATARLRVPSK
jgi:23S rRNA pseudouridine1911/1915/1917 synthase